MTSIVSGFLMKRRFFIFLSAILILILMLLFSKPVRVDGGLEGFYISDNPYTTSGERLDSFYPGNENIQIIITPKNSKIPTLFHGLSRLDSSLLSKFRGSSVHSLDLAKDYILSTFPNEYSTFQLLDSLKKTPLLEQVVSKDRKQLLMILFIKDSSHFDLDTFNYLISQEYSGIEKISALSQRHISKQLEMSLQEDLIVITIGLLLFILLVVWLIFRDLKSFFLFCINFVLCIIPLIFLFGAMNIKLNMLTIMTFSLVLMYSLSDAIHLVMGYFHSKHIVDKTQRIQYNLQRFLIPSFLTSFTTAVAFFSFYFNDSEYIRQFGIISGMVVMLEYFITFLTFPYLMKILPNTSIQNPILEFISTKIILKRKWAGIAMISIFVVSLFFIHRLEFKTDFDSLFPINTELNKTHQNFTENFEYLMGIDVLMNKKPSSHSDVGIKQLSLKLHKQFVDIPKVEKVTSCKDQLEFQQQLGLASVFMETKTESLFLRNAASRIHIAIKNPEDSKFVYSEIQKLVRRYSADFEFNIHSQALLFNYIDEKVAQSILMSFISSAIIIFLIFGFMTKSLRNTLVCMLANLIPVGALVLLFLIFNINLNLNTALIGVLCLGIIVDDTIQILYRKLDLKEELNELSYSMFSSSFLLTGGFLFFTLSNFQPTRNFGFLSACVFIIAWLCDMAIMNWLLKTKNTTQNES